MPPPTVKALLGDQDAMCWRGESFFAILIFATLAILGSAKVGVAVFYGYSGGLFIFCRSKPWRDMVHPAFCSTSCRASSRSSFTLGLMLLFSWMTLV